MTKGNKHLHLFNPKINSSPPKPIKAIIEKPLASLKLNKKHDNVTNIPHDSKTVKPATKSQAKNSDNIMYFLKELKNIETKKENKPSSSQRIN